MTIKQRIQVLTNSIIASDNQYANEDVQAVEDFISDCGNYVDKVTTMEAALSVARFRMEPDEYREFIIRLDRNRKYAHDALIASVRVMNRLCGVYDVAKIYEGPDERIPIGDFALEVSTEFFKERKL